MKKLKESVFVKALKKIFLKETTIKKDGTEVKGLTPAAIILIIMAIVGGLVVLEFAGIIDDVVAAFGKKPHVERHR